MRPKLAATSPMAQQVLLERVQGVLTGLGVPHPATYAQGLSYQKRLCLQHFWLACHEFNLSLQWGSLQIEAYLLHLDDEYLVASGIKRHWKVLSDIVGITGRKLSADQKTLYDYVLANCHSVKDDKLPISLELLTSICDNAQFLFAPYDTALFRCLFLVAWGAFMRVCEYTSARSGRKDHNIYAQSVEVTDLGCGVTFLSDKVSKDDPTPKYRFIDWPFLPPFVKQAISLYSSLRPKGAKHFFVREDGRPLTRDDMVDALDLCVLHSPFWRMKYMSHAFRIGGASQARLAGVNILQIQNQGHWGKNSKAVEHYTRQQFLRMTPDQLYAHTKYRRNWTDAKLRYLAKRVVQTPGDRSHKHHLMLQNNFPEFVCKEGASLPYRYPQPQVLYQLKQRKVDRVQGTFIKPYISQRTWELHLHNLQTSIRGLAGKVAAHHASNKDHLELARLKKLHWEMVRDTGAAPPGRYSLRAPHGCHLYGAGCTDRATSDVIRRSSDQPATAGITDRWNCSGHQGLGCTDGCL